MNIWHDVQDWRAELQPGVFKPCLQLSITFGTGTYSTANAVVAEYPQKHGTAPAGAAFQFGLPQSLEGWVHDEADLPKLSRDLQAQIESQHFGLLFEWNLLEHRCPEWPPPPRQSGLAHDPKKFARGCLLQICNFEASKPALIEPPPKRFRTIA